MQAPVFLLNKHHRLALAIVSVTQAICAYVWAGPEGGQVVAGQGVIEQAEKETRIQQASERLAIDWQSFDVNSDERVQFIQPNSSSIAFNRILSNKGSLIQGRIDANGQVVLINPNGLIFTKDATVNAGALIASGLQINSQDFLNGQFTLNALEGTEGRVVNSGILQAATGGNISLIGQSVENKGLISAQLGSVNLAAGKEAVLTFEPNGLIGVKVSKAILQNDLGVDAAVINSGEIIAEAGKVLLTAITSKDVFSLAVNTSELQSAKSVVVHEDGSFTLGAGVETVNAGVINVSSNLNKGGEVVLLGNNIANSGSINADGKTQGGSIEFNSTDKTQIKQQGKISANASNGKGGDIKVLGDKVGLLDQAQVSASGSQGGGQVLLGGDQSGKNARVNNAQFLFTGQDTQTRADANSIGDGGRIIAFAKDTARIYGALSAAGGEFGKGGFVETSGLRGLDIGVTPNLTALSGNAGQWLIDPYDVVISDTANNADFKVSDNYFTPNFDDAFIAWGKIQSALSTGNGAQVTISTGKDIAGQPAGIGNIYIATGFDFNVSGRKSGTLTLDAAKNITFGKTLNDQGAEVNSAVSEVKASGDDTLNFVFTAGGKVDLGGATLSSNGGNVTITANGFSASGNGGVATGAGDVGNLDAGNPNINNYIAGGNFTYKQNATGTPGDFSLLGTAQIKTYGGTISLGSADAPIKSAVASATGTTLSTAFPSGGGDIEIFATGDVSLGNLTLKRRYDYAAPIKAGSIDVISTGGSITWNNVFDFNNTSTRNELGAGDPSVQHLNLTAGQNITINGNIFDSFGDARDAFSINLTAAGKLLLNSDIFTAGGNLTAKANQIDMVAGKRIDTDNANASAQGNSPKIANFSEGGNLSLQASDTITLGSIITDGNCTKPSATSCTGNLLLSKRTDINPTLNAPIISQLDNTTLNVNGITTIDIGAGTANLIRANSFKGEITSPSVNNLSVVNSVATVLGKSQATLDFNITSQTGNITQNANMDQAIKVGRLATFTASDTAATGGNVVLNNGANNFTQLGIGPTKAATVFDANQIDIKNINTPSLTLNTSDSATFSGNIDITNKNVAITQNGKGSVLLGDLVSAFSTSGNAVNTVTFKNAGTASLRYTGPQTATWDLTAKSLAYSVGANAKTFKFDGFANLTGGTGTNIFKLSGPLVTTPTLTGSAGADELIIDAANAINNWSLKLFADAQNFETATLGVIQAKAIDNVKIINGGNATNTRLIVAPDSATAWNLTPVNNEFTLKNDDSAKVTFSGFKNLIGGGGVDTFDFSALGNGPLFAGVLDGGEGLKDEIKSPLSKATWDLSQDNTPTQTNTKLTRLNGNNQTESVSFRNFEVLTGSAAEDTVKLSNAIAKVSLDADLNVGLQLNAIDIIAATASNAELIGYKVSSSWKITSENEVEVKKIGDLTNTPPVKFSNFVNLTSNADAANKDVFTFDAAGKITGKVTGQVGDTLNARTGVANTWDISDKSLFTIKSPVNNVLAPYVTATGFGIVKGGDGNDGNDGNDTFTFANGISEYAGAIDALGGTNIINTNSASVNFTNGLPVRISGITGITELNGQGAGAQVTVKSDKAVSWSDIAVNDNALNKALKGTVADAGHSLKFDGFLVLNGGDQDDTFTLSNAPANLVGTINGAGGSSNKLINKLEASQWNLEARTLRGLTFDKISILQGSSKDLLTASNTVNTWKPTNTDIKLTAVISDTENRQYELTGFAGFIGGELRDTFNLNVASAANFDGGKGDDIFVINASQTGMLNGGADKDTFTVASTSTFTIGGGDDSDTLSVVDGKNTWLVNGINKGSLNGQNFSDIENLSGGIGEDNFTLKAVGAVNSIAGGDAAVNGANPIDSFTNEITNERFLLTGKNDGQLDDGLAEPTKVLTFFGFESLTGEATGTNTLQGADTLDNKWKITAANRGDINGVAFANMKQLIGSALNDEFDFSPGGAVTKVSGGKGKGINIFVGRSTGNTWKMTSLVDGSHSESKTEFDNIQEFRGGLGGDEMDFSTVENAEIVASNFTDIEKITGATSAILVGGNTANTWNLSGLNEGKLNNNQNFSGFGTLRGGNQQDVFVLADIGRFTGTLDGGGNLPTALDKLQLLNKAGIWTVTSQGKGDVKYISNISAQVDQNSTTQFANIEHLIGGAADDSFDLSKIPTTQMLTMFLDAGAGTATDTIQLPSGDMTIALSASQSTPSAIAGIALGNFENIEATLGSNSTLQALSGTADWQINDQNKGVLKLQENAATSETQFTNFKNIKGGTGVDTFTFGEAGQILGSIEGQAGDILKARDTENHWQFPESLTGKIQLADKVDAAYAKNISGITVFNGGTGVDIFTFNNLVNATVNGGKGDDSFIFAGAGELKGQLNGDEGKNTLQGLSDKPMAWQLSSINAGEMRSNNKILANFTGIQIIAGKTDADSLTSFNSLLETSSWKVTNTSVYLGKSGELELQGFDEIIAGAGVDNFVVEGQFKGLINTAGGNDRVEFSTNGAVGNLQGGAGRNILQGRDAKNDWLIKDLEGNGKVTDALGAAYIDNFKQFGYLIGSKTPHPDTGLLQDSLTGPDLSDGNKWVISGTSNDILNGIYKNSLNGIGFENMRNLNGGALKDTFKFESSLAFAGIIDGKTGDNFVDVSAFDSNFVLDGTTVQINGVANVTGIRGKGVDSQLSLQTDSDATWTFTKENYGEVSFGTKTFSFDNFGKVLGGKGKDTFDFSTNATGSIQSIDGGDGDGLNTIDGRHGLNTWSLEGTKNVLSVTNGSAYVSEFSRIQILNGGDFADIYNVSAAKTLQINAGKGADIVDISATLNGGVNFGSDADAIVLRAGGKVTGKVIADGTARISETDGANTWKLSSVYNGILKRGTEILADFTGFNSLAGGSGKDTLIAAAAPGISEWNLSTVDQTLTQGAFTSHFRDMDTLQGSTGDDNFILNMAWAGDINTDAGVNKVELKANGSIKNLVAGAGLQDSLIGRDKDSLWQLTPTGNSLQLLSGEKLVENFTGIETLHGSKTALDSLKVSDTVNLWQIDTVADGAVNAFKFYDMDSLEGSDLDDTFSFAGDIRFNNSNSAIDAKGGVNLVKLASAQSSVTAVLGNQSVINGVKNANGISATAENAQLILQGGDAALWTITGKNAGNIKSKTNLAAPAFNFDNFANLKGGDNSDDEFVIAKTDTTTGAITGSLNGAGGQNSLHALEAGNHWTLGSNNQIADASDNVYVAKFENFQTLTGGQQQDVFAINGLVNSTIVGGAGGDRFTLAANSVVVGNINGGEDDDVIALAAGAKVVGNVIGGNGRNTLSLAEGFNRWQLTSFNSGAVASAATSTGVAQPVASFNEIQVLQGGSGVDRLIGFNINADWQLNTDEYFVRESNNPNSQKLVFINMDILQGGISDDRFTLNTGFAGDIFADAGNDELRLGETGSVNSFDGQGGTDTLWGRSAGSIWMLGINTGTTAQNSLLTAREAVYVKSFEGVEALQGSATASDFLRADFAQNNWQLNSADSGSVNSIAFFNIDKLRGTSGNDNFTFNFAGKFNNSENAIDALAGTNEVTLSAAQSQITLDFTNASINGVKDANRVTAKAGNSTLNIVSTTDLEWQITGKNFGSVKSVGANAREFGFVDFANLVSADTADNFVIGAEGSVSGLLDGKLGDNTLKAKNASNLWTFGQDTNGAQINTLALVDGAVYVGNFINIQNLQGNDGADIFKLTQNYTGNLYGNGGNDRFEIGAVLAAMENRYGNIAGGAGDDVFVLQKGAKVAGDIDGGAGNNQLEGFTDPSLWQLTATNKGSVSVDNRVLAKFDAIQTIKSGTGNDTLSATNLINPATPKPATWSLGQNTSSLVIDSQPTLVFSGIENIEGTTTQDIFNVDAAITQLNTGAGDDNINVLSGGAIKTLNAGEGKDTLKGKSAPNQWTFTDTATAQVAAGSSVYIDNFAGVERLEGNVSDELTSAGVQNQWLIDRSQGGSLNGVQFANFTKLRGGKNQDTFTFSGDGSFASEIEGGEGVDTLNAKNSTNQWTITSATSGQVAIGAASPYGLYAGIESLVGAQNGVDTFVLKPGVAAVNALAGDNLGDVLILEYNANLVVSNDGKTLAGIKGIENLTAKNLSDTASAKLVNTQASGNWVIDGLDTGTLGQLRFSGFTQLEGGSGVDNFKLVDKTARISGTIDGGNSAETINPVDVLQGPAGESTAWTVQSSGQGYLQYDGKTQAFVGIEQIKGSNQGDTFKVDKPGVAINIQAGTGQDTLQLPEGGVDITLGQQEFGGIGISGLDKLVAAVNGDNILRSSTVNAEWSVTELNKGSLKAGALKLEFENFQTLIGGSADDTFELKTDGALSKGLQGGGGNNSLTTQGDNFVFALTGELGDITQNNNRRTGFSQIQTLTHQGANAQLWAADQVNHWQLGANNSLNDLKFSGIQTLVGNRNADVFVVAGFSDVAIVGSRDETAATALDSLEITTATDARLTWTITSNNTGSVQSATAPGLNQPLGLGQGFSGIEQLLGGDGQDDFVFAVTGNLAGGLDGGAGRNSLSRTSGVNQWRLGGLDAEGHPPADFLNAMTVGRVQQIVGSGSDQLLAANDANTWTLGRGLSGELTQEANNQQRQLSFSGIKSIAGGKAQDVFVLLNSGTGGFSQLQGGSSGELAGTVLDRLDASALGDNLAILLDKNLSPLDNRLRLVAEGIEVLNVGTGNNAVYGDSGNRLWTLNGQNSGNSSPLVGSNPENSLSFNNIGSIYGGTGQDRFAFEPGAKLTGEINGGGGTNKDYLDYSRYIASANEEVVLGENSLYKGIEGVIGDSAGKLSLRATGNGSTWNIGDIDGDGTLSDGLNDGQVILASGSVEFINFAKLMGTSGRDLFTLNGSFQGSIQTLAGNDQITLNANRNQLMEANFFTDKADSLNLAWADPAETGTGLIETYRQDAKGREQIKIEGGTTGFALSFDAVNLLQDNLKVANARIQTAQDWAGSSQIAWGDDLLQITQTPTVGSPLTGSNLKLTNKQSLTLSGQATDRLTLTGANQLAGVLTVEKLSVSQDPNVSGQTAIKAQGLVFDGAGALGDTANPLTFEAGQLRISNQQGEANLQALSSVKLVGLDGKAAIKLAVAGDLTQDTALIFARNLNLSAANITLNNPANRLTGDLNLAATGDIALANGITNLQSLKANNWQYEGADLAATGPVTVAGLVQINSQGSVSLSNAANSLGSLGVQSLGNVHVQAATGLSLKTSTVAGELNISSQGLLVEADQTADALVLAAGKGKLQLNGTLTAKTAIDLSGEGIALNTAIKAPNLTLNAGGEDLLINKNILTTSAFTGTGKSITESAGVVISSRDALWLTATDAITLAGDLTSGNSIVLQAQGAIEQKGLLQTQVGGNDGNVTKPVSYNIQLQSTQGDVRMAETAATKSAGSVVYQAGGNIEVRQLDAKTAVELNAAGKVSDANGQDLNVSAPRLTLISGKGVASEGDLLELSVDNLVGQHQGTASVNILNNKTLMIDQLISDASINVVVSQGNLIFNNTDTNSFTSGYDINKPAGKAAGGLLNANFDLGTLNATVSNGSIIAKGQAIINKPDLVAREVNLFAGRSIGEGGRPLVIYAQKVNFTSTLFGWNPRWAFGKTDTGYTNNNPLDLSQLLLAAGDQLIEVEPLEDVNPAVFTDIRNYSSDAISILLPEDQRYE